MQRLLGNARNTEPFTEEEHRQRTRQRGMEAFDAICEIARELQGTTQVIARQATEAPVPDPFSRILDIARELRNSAPPAVLPPVSRVGSTSAANSVSSVTAPSGNLCTDTSVESTDRPVQSTSEPNHCRSKPPYLLHATEFEPESRHYDVHDTVRLPIPTFDGTNGAAFKSVFESVAKHYRWSDEIKALRLKCLDRQDGAETRKARSSSKSE